jgi:hypothetical protein
LVPAASEIDAEVEVAIANAVAFGEAGSVPAPDLAPNLMWAEVV